MSWQRIEVICVAVALPVVNFLDITTEQVLWIKFQWGNFLLLKYILNFYIMVWLFITLWGRSKLIEWRKGLEIRWFFLSVVEHEIKFLSLIIFIRFFIYHVFFEIYGIFFIFLIRNRVSALVNLLNLGQYRMYSWWVWRMIL